MKRKELDAGDKRKAKRRMTVKHLGTKRIETDRLILRRFTVEDAEKMYQNWAGDPEVTKFLTWPTHKDAEVSKAVLTDWVSSYNKEDKYEWCIALKEKDEPIGSIGVVNCNEKVKSMEIGYCIGREYWHQGITSEALVAVMRFLLEEVGADRIEARHDARNPYSGAVMKKCGMRYEGIRIKADWNNSGICDCVLYGYVKGVTEQQPAPGAESPEKPDRLATAEETAVGNTAQSAATEEMADGNAAQSATADQTTADNRTPKNVISDETIEYVGILAKLELSDEEKERAKKDMGEMLDYIDKLNELDTEGVEPMSHVFPVNNVFREDIVTNGDGSEATLANAPEKKDGGFKVPKTIA